MFYSHYGIVLCYNVETQNNNYMDVVESGCGTTKQSLTSQIVCKIFVEI